MSTLSLTAFFFNPCLPQIFIAAKPEHLASRCPLCHADIPPSDDGWLNHLLEEKCPKNPRTQKAARKR